MPLLTDKHIEARRCLAVGSYLTDPKYLYPQEVALAKFKDRCRACWHLRDYWPKWVRDYADKWAAEAKK